ncbi:hypothetical protein [Ciceribacter selenitireducens]
MKTIRVFGIASIALLGTALPAFAGIESLIAGTIQGFLLASTAIPAAATGAIATLAANAILYGSASGGFTFLSERRHERD